MLEHSVQTAANLAKKKRTSLAENPLGYFIASILAGMYVGVGIILIFAVGSPFYQAGHPAVKLVMGASFGIALTLVVYAGAELYTGNTFFMGLGWLRGTVKLRDVGLIWIVSWIGNLVGALAIAWLVTQTSSLEHARQLIMDVSAMKTAASVSVLIPSAILCNFLVCLALWMGLQTKSDTAKILLICLCLFAFIASGYEHSIANMSLIAIGLFQHTGSDISWSGYIYNILWVTLGNTIAGAVILAGSYHIIAGRVSTGKEKV